MKQFSYLLTPVLFILATTAMLAQESTTTVGGYGELHYNEPEGSAKGQLDFHRFVIYLGHEFNEWISFTSEVELEHAVVSNEENTGELAVEQAYLELRPFERYGFRAGIVLAPVGLVNQYHEPPTFNGVERPNFHKSLVPSTWREAGAGVFGNPLDNLSFHLYTLAGFAADGFSAKDGLRGGRQLALHASTADMGLTGRVDYMPVNGLAVGASFYTGGSTHGVDSLESGNVSMLAADLRYSVGHFQLRTEAVLISVGDADRINSAFGRSVADEMSGWYAEAAYDVLPHLTDTAQRLLLFARYEVINTQASTTGFDPIAKYDRTETTIGLTWLPVSSVVLKADYQLFGNASTDDPTGQFNAGIGYAFF